MLQSDVQYISMSPNIQIRPVTPDDIPHIFQLIKGLAEYERLMHRFTATESSLREALFGPRPYAEVLLAYAGGEPVGIAVFFHNLSTFTCKPGIYLEDLFVPPDWRGRGIGAKLMARLAELALQRGCERINWSVLDWNEPALRFYLGLGAEPDKDWVGYTISGEKLLQLARRNSLP